jgi:hypothetical protein
MTFQQLSNSWHFEKGHFDSWEILESQVILDTLKKDISIVEEFLAIWKRTS